MAAGEMTRMITPLPVSSIPSVLPSKFVAFGDEQRG